jgi:hypothetical protein
MGAAYELTCEKCGYQSGMVLLGCTRDSSRDRVLGSCRSCGELTSLFSDKLHDDCVLCGAVAQVVATSTLRHSKFLAAFRRETPPKFECPKCHTFSVEKPDTPSMFMD